MKDDSKQCTRLVETFCPVQELQSQLTEIYPSQCVRKQSLVRISLETQAHGPALYLYANFF